MADDQSGFHGLTLSLGYGISFGLARQGPDVGLPNNGGLAAGVEVTAFGSEANNSP